MEMMREEVCLIPDARDKGFGSHQQAGVIVSCLPN